MEWLISNREIVLYFTSLFAFFYSIIDIISKRTNIKMEIAEYYLYRGKDYNEYTFCINIDNNSSKPISITKLLIKGNNGLYTRCFLTPVYKGETYFPHYPETDLPLTNRILSASFQSILPLQNQLYSELFLNLIKMQIFIVPITLSLLKLLLISVINLLNFTALIRKQRFQRFDSQKFIVCKITVPIIKRQVSVSIVSFDIIFLTSLSDTVRSIGLTL